MDAIDAWLGTARNKFARWNYDEARFSDPVFSVHHDPKFTLQASDKFFCIGSCFARNVEEHLIYSFIDVLSKRVYSPIEEWSNRPNAFMNKYTIASMLNELRWAISPPSSPPASWFMEVDGGWHDPQLSPAAHPTSFERVVERRRYLSAEVFSRIRIADVVVITLGLVEAWFDNETGLWLNGAPPLRLARSQLGRYSFSSTSVSQNRQWLSEVRTALKILNPAVKMIVTVSPVPMDTTFSGRDSAASHVISKARLRVVADEFVAEHDDADYFPSFEMVSLAPHALAFGEDHLHPEDATVGSVVRHFVKTFIPNARSAAGGYHEMTYLRSHPDVYAAVRRGELTSGFEHWIAADFGKKTVAPGSRAVGDLAPRLAILFWFYKEFELCRSRVEELRRLNPDTAIYGLYGGTPEEAGAARSGLEAILDDLYLFETPSTGTWRWFHGDQVIAAWARERGFALPWDTVVLVQWDLLMTAPLSELFSELRADEAIFSGDRPLEEIKHWWGWGGAHQSGRDAVAAFRRWLQQAHDYDGPLWACLFIFAALPRRFLERYAADGPPTDGFLEHKLPTMARVYDISVRAEPRLAPWWKADPTTADAPEEARLLNAAGLEPSDEAIRRELARADGRRVFHPVSRSFSLAGEFIAPPYST